jgi:hypothetical protein
MIRELTVHASIEEQIFYPRVRQDAQDTVLIESVRHHVKEEEGSLFPAVRKAFGRPALVAMGDALAAAKKGAPVKPRPRLPDVPPLNRLADAGAGAVDRAVGSLKKAATSR